MREIILIDFFDTVMFREVHSFQLLPQWAKIISEKYGLNQDLLGIRKKLENEFKDNIYEIPYKELIKNIFDMLDMDCSFDEFYKFCFDTEVNIDLSTQYPNSFIIRRLKRQRMPEKRFTLFQTIRYQEKPMIFIYLILASVNYLMEFFAVRITMLQNIEVPYITSY